MSDWKIRTEDSRWEWGGEDWVQCNGARMDILHPRKGKLSGITFAEAVELKSTLDEALGDKVHYSWLRIAEDRDGITDGDTAKVPSACAELPSDAQPGDACPTCGFAVEDGRRGVWCRNGWQKALLRLGSAWNSGPRYGR